ncbi:UNVERIFIED_CONTAM: hypothetical protein HDU68_011373 [Siphonaria sp. JEL0065]|nr:hypothetical protein HDU68_011373 [Siphonaria sp. JEL0065]
MDLNVLRTKIDSLDTQLVELLNERAQVSINIGLAKGSAAATASTSDEAESKKRKLTQDHIHQPARELKVYERVKKLNHGPLKDGAIEAIYREIMSASISLQRQITVAFLGPRGSYTAQVASNRFGDSVAYSDMPTIGDVIKAVLAKTVTYGVVPIENSTMGNVDATLDALVKATQDATEDNKVQIRAEHYLPIHHCLLSTAADKSLIKKVYSHAQSIGQTSQWYDANMKGVERVAVSSNSAAAVLASKEPGSAAICGEQCAEMYGLNVLERNIEDKKNNTTRFFILGDKCEPPTGSDKTILYFTVDHRQPGSLVDALNVLKKREINLTKIDSRPSGASPWNYFFFIECTGHWEDERVKLALVEMKEFCLEVHVLGSYPDQRPQA